MNKTRVILVIVVAILLALLASVGIYRYLSEKGRVAEQARLQTVGIVVALVDIPVGATINANQVAVTAWPKDLYPKDSFSDPKQVVGNSAPGLVVLNPPYGRRLQPSMDIETFYRTIGTRLARAYKGWRAAVLIPFPDLAAKMPPGLLMRF